VSLNVQYFDVEQLLPQQVQLSLSSGQAILMKLSTMLE